MISQLQEVLFCKLFIFSMILSDQINSYSIIDAGEVFGAKLATMLPLFHQLLTVILSLQICIYISVKSEGLSPKMRFFLHHLC